MNSLLIFQGRDKFQNGKGGMLIKMNFLINIVNEQDEKLDEGTLQRYLGEMVWFPSLALSPFVTWEQINDTTAKAKRHDWTMIISDYKIFEGIKVPSIMTSTWKLDEGDWTWFKLEVTDIRYNKNASH